MVSLSLRVVCTSPGMQTDLTYLPAVRYHACSQSRRSWHVKWCGHLHLESILRADHFHHQATRLSAHHHVVWMKLWYLMAFVAASPELHFVGSVPGHKTLIASRIDISSPLAESIHISQLRYDRRKTPVIAWVAQSAFERGDNLQSCVSLWNSTSSSHAPWGLCLLINIEIQGQSVHLEQSLSQHDRYVHSKLIWLKGLIYIV